jgi:hypothetical protein
VAREIVPIMLHVKFCLFEIKSSLSHSLHWTVTRECGRNSSNPIGAIQCYSVPKARIGEHSGSTLHL